jgi:hypothetical protein
MDCQVNDISSPNFLRNAEINLKKSQRGLAWLRLLRRPKELQPVIDYLLHGLELSVWTEEIEFRYYTNWSESVLKEMHYGSNPAQHCLNVFKKLETATSQEEKYRIVRFDWAGCAKAVGTRQGQYPIDSWNAFLREYGIGEHYEEKTPD